MSSVSNYHPSSKWPSGMHTIPITREQASLMLDRVMRLYRTGALYNYIVLKHIETNTIHKLRVISPFKDKHMDSHVQYLTQRMSDTPDMNDCFAGYFMFHEQRSEMVDCLVQKYETAYTYHKNKELDMIECSLVTLSSHSS